MYARFGLVAVAYVHGPNDLVRFVHSSRGRVCDNNDARENFAAECPVTAMCVRNCVSNVLHDMPTDGFNIDVRTLAERRNQCPTRGCSYTRL